MFFSLLPTVLWNFILKIKYLSFLSLSPSRACRFSRRFGHASPMPFSISTDASHRPVTTNCPPSPMHIVRVGVRRSRTNARVSVCLDLPPAEVFSFALHTALTELAAFSVDQLKSREKVKRRRKSERSASSPLDCHSHRSGDARNGRKSV